MYVIVWHELLDPPVAFDRGERLKRADGAPDGTRVLQFLPAADGLSATCLWESDSVADVQSYVDEVLGSASRNRCYALEDAAAFATLPEGIGSPAATAGA